MSANKGFVLVTVIWLSAILAAFAVSVSVSVRSHALFARNAASGALAAGIADGLLQLTALDLAHASQAARGARADGSWRACRWSKAAQAWISVQDQNGLVDLNMASAPLMIALLRGLGLPPDQALVMSGAMRDYRDADSNAGQGGPEPSAYPGRPFGPKNAPFDAVEELDQIPGMTPELLQRLRSLATVSSQQPGIDFAAAPDALLQALHISRAAGASSPFAGARGSPVSAITVAVQLADGTRFVRRALLEWTDQPNQPFVTTSWDSQPWPASLGPASSSACLANEAGILAADRRA